MKHSISVLLTIAMTLSACMHIPTASHSSETLATCYFQEFGQPMSLGYAEFAKIMADFERSTYALDVLVVIVRPGREGPKLKRLIQSESGYALITAIGNQQDSMRTQCNAECQAVLAHTAKGYFSLNDDSETAHAPYISLLIRRSGKTESTYYFNTYGLSCRNDTMNQKMVSGYAAAQYLLDLQW
ncbi:hypothetical protein LGH70_06000 [Hymenobacter sp. BT635]|uniref:Lipoprotein n=1 Tax=Hymenobacter nitidus TaxID=2880929 RepID=A0ABS8A9R9_9BACT|nr:hypothetical protein [Hymenobacter nitidus]MCB2377125.1 hypothetical protein [Hymenobacter nitidus]